MAFWLPSPQTFHWQLGRQSAFSALAGPLSQVSLPHTLPSPQPLVASPGGALFTQTLG